MFILFGKLYFYEHLFTSLLLHKLDELNLQCKLHYHMAKLTSNKEKKK